MFDLVETLQTGLEEKHLIWHGSLSLDTDKKIEAEAAVFVHKHICS